MGDADLLFVLGLGRSGTTALTDVMSAHTSIAVGMERYKALYPRSGEFVTPELFEHDRFFDFSDGLTNLTPDVSERWASFYQRLEVKWDSVDFVGDKLTKSRIQHLWKTVPDARFLCIIRDIEQVAASWDARARNEDDQGWAPEADARSSVVKWNETLRRIRRAARQRPDQIAVVEHGRFFGDPDGAALTSVLTWLGLERDQTTDEQFARAHARFVETIAPKERVLPAEMLEHLEKAADRKAWKQLQELAL